MKFLYLVLGTLFLIIGSIGIVLPILPTTPFLLLTTYLYARGSKRFNDWFLKTKLYQRYLLAFLENRTMKKKEKWQLLIFVDFIILISILIAQSLFVTIFLITIDVIKYIYFQTQIKTT